MNHQHPTTKLTPQTTRLASIKKEDDGPSSPSNAVQVAPGIRVQVPRTGAGVVHFVPDPDRAKMRLRELSPSRSISSSMSQEYAQKRARYSISAATQRVLEWQQEQRRLFIDSRAMHPPPPPNTVRQLTRQPPQKSHVPPRIFGIASQHHSPQPPQSNSSSTSQQSSLSSRITTIIPSPPQSPGPDSGESQLPLSRETSSSDQVSHATTAPRQMNTPLKQMQAPAPQAQLAPPQAQPVPPQAKSAPPQAQLEPPQAQPEPPQAQPVPPQAKSAPPQAQPEPPQAQPVPLPSQPALMSWNECLRLPVGRLPRSADCRFHNKHLLAQIPFRTSESRTPGSMYRHFFQTLAPHVDVNAVKRKLNNRQDLEYEDYGKGIYDPREKPPYRPRPPKTVERTAYLIMCLHSEKDGSICGETMLTGSTRKNDHCMKEHAATWQALNDFRSEQTRGRVHPVSHLSLLISLSRTMVPILRVSIEIY